MIRPIPAFTSVLLLAATAAAQDFAAQRARLLTEIRGDAARTAGLTGRGELDPRVLTALARVPRHEFVPAPVRHLSYENRPLPIGHGQTISQPYIVALMTDLARVGPGSRVLEIGTGSGYQAAVLAELGVQVFSIEIIEPLAIRAKSDLGRSGYESVTIRAGDGYFGWEQRAPYDAILVTAAASHVPPPLVGQLKPGGRVVIPVGNPYQTQQLTVVEKAEDGTVSMRQLLPVVFVPLTGGP